MYSSTSVQEDTKTGSEQGGFVFLGRFGFDENPQPVEMGKLVVGHVEVEITLKDSKDYATTPITLDVLQYTDNDSDWPVVYDKSVPCKDKLNPPEIKTATFGPDGKMLQPITLEAKGGVRRRFHYVAVRNCNGFGKFDYKLHFTREASSWSREFGVNELGLNSLYVFYFIFYILLVIANVFNFKKATTALTYKHPIYTFFNTMIVIAFVSTFLHFIHFVSFTSNGVGSPSLHLIGQVLDIAVHIAFILLLMLLAKGWAITKSNLTQRKVILGFVGIFGFLYIIAFLVKRAAFNPASVDGLPQGVRVFYYLIISVGFVFALWYAYTAFSTYAAENNPIKRSFMMRLAILFFIYLLSIPLIGFLSALVDPWVRDIVVAGFTLTCNSIGFLVLTLLLWYSHATKYFEFDNPVELMSDTDFQRL